MPDTEKLSTQAEQSEDPTKDLGVGRKQREQDTKDIKNQEKEAQEKKDNPYEQLLEELEKELAAHTDEATAKNFIETNRKVLVEEASLQLNLDLNPFVNYLRRCSKEEITLFSKKEESYLKIHNNFTKGNLKNKDLEDSQFWLIHNLDWLQSADSDYYLKVWDWCEDIDLAKIKKLAIDDYKLESLKSLSDEQLLKNVRKLTLNKTVFEETFKSTDVSIVELKSSNLNITGAAKSSKVSSGHEVYKSFLDGLANPEVPVDINTGRLKVNTELQSKQDCDYLCQIFVDANLGSREEQKEIVSDKNKLKISQEILKDLKKDGKLPKEAEKKLADVGIKVEESISYMTKLNELENFLNENLDTEGEESMPEYKYLAHDDEGKIKDKVFDKFEDAYDYCQDGLVTFISELVYEDGQEDEDLEEIVWSWDDTHDRDEAIKSVTSRHQTVENISENPEITEVTEEKPEEDVEFKAAAVEADNPVDFLNQIAKELGVEDEIKVVEVEPAESKFGLSNIPDVEFPENESLQEASSSFKKAFKHGRKDVADYLTGKAISRIRDPKARDAAVAAKKAGRDDVVQAFTGDRKQAQAERAYEKKAISAYKSGLGGEKANDIAGKNSVDEFKKRYGPYITATYFPSKISVDRIRINDHEIISSMINDLYDMIDKHLGYKVIFSSYAMAQLLCKVDSSGTIQCSTNKFTKIITYYALEEKNFIIPAKLNDITVTKIGDSAFKNCGGFKTVYIPNSVTHIGRNAFCGCLDLEVVHIPSSVISIGRDAFAACIILDEIDCANEDLIDKLEEEYEDVDVSNWGETGDYVESFDASRKTQNSLSESLKFTKDMTVRQFLNKNKIRDIDWRMGVVSIYRDGDDKLTLSPSTRKKLLNAKIDSCWYENAYDNGGYNNAIGLSVSSEEIDKYAGSELTD